MNSVKIPTKQECYNLLKKYKVPGQVVRHTEAVKKVAVFLAKKLKESGEDVNVELVERSALLHDFCKVIDFVDTKALWDKKPTKEDMIFYKKLQKQLQSEGHCIGAGNLLKNKYPELALIIQKHRFVSPVCDDKPETWEEKIVWYSDKRVLHLEKDNKVTGFKVVSIKKRFDDGMERYKAKLSKPDFEKHQLVGQEAHKIENQIFKNLDITPDDVNKFVKV